MESDKSKIRPSKEAIEVDLKVGSVFDAAPVFITNPLYKNGELKRPKNLALYLKNPETGRIFSAFIKGMPVEDYDGQNEIPLIIRKILPETEDGRPGVVYLEQRLEAGDAICLKPDRMSNRKRFFTRFFSYNVFIEMYGKDGRKFFLNEPMAVLINYINKTHAHAKAMPYERISREQYEENKFKIIRAKKD